MLAVSPVIDHAKLNQQQSICLSGQRFYYPGPSGEASSNCAD